MMAYGWPGNVRELINVLEYAFVVCREDAISVQHLPMLAGKELRAGHYRKRNVAENGERERLVRALEETGGIRQKAAERLGISRVTLWKLLKKHGIRPEVKFTSP